MFNGVIAFIVLALIVYVGYHIHCNRYWKDRVIDNFPFIHKGKMFWYSRACSTTLFVFAKNKDGVWHVLANKRGQGTPDFQGMWNAPCGYLNFNETGEESAQREVFEETGVFVPKDEIKFWRVDTSPSQNKQNVSLKYTAILSGICEAYTFDTSHMEDKEVEEVAWIPVNEIKNFRWAFNHDNILNNVISSVLEK